MRIAEPTVGAQAIIYVCAKVVEDKAPTLLGLSSKRQHRIAGDRVYLCSLMTAGHDVRGCVECPEETLNKVNIVETLNPYVRGFRTLRITIKI